MFGLLFALFTFKDFQEGVNVDVCLACTTVIKLKEKVEGGGVIWVRGNVRGTPEFLLPSFKNCYAGKYVIEF